MTNYFENAVALRRTLHQYPELGWGEFKTTALIAKELESLGWQTFLGAQQVDPKAVMGRNEALVAKSLARAKEEGADPAVLEKMEGYTGCIGLFDTGRPGPVTALRFDIDCVGVEETNAPEHIPNAQGFASKHPGAMHSCGHDGHTAMGLTIARWVKDNAEKLNGKIKLIFQPAEEGVRGAAAQAASGQLDDVDYLIGSHLALMCKSGEICTYPTNVLSTTKLDVKLFGKPAHPTMSPELGRNALACLCTCVSELLAMAGHSKGMSCINVGHIEAGEFRNVIPATGLIQLEVRGSTAEINDYMVQQATRLIQGTCLAYGVDYDITKAGEATELVNDEGLVELVNKVAKNTEGVHTVVREKEMSGSEDFTVLAARVRAHGGKTEFFILGSDRAGAHHQKNFDFDETSLRVGFDIYTKCLEELNG